MWTNRTAQIDWFIRPHRLLKLLPWLLWLRHQVSLQIPEHAHHLRENRNWKRCEIQRVWSRFVNSEFNDWLVSRQSLAAWHTWIATGWPRLPSVARCWWWWCRYGLGLVTSSQLTCLKVIFTLPGTHDSGVALDVELRCGKRRWRKTYATRGISSSVITAVAFGDVSATP